MVTADLTPLRDVLNKLGDKPAALAAREVKKGYAERLPREIALMVVNRLCGQYSHANVTPRSVSEPVWSALAKFLGQVRLLLRVSEDVRIEIGNHYDR